MLQNATSQNTNVATLSRPKPLNSNGSWQEKGLDSYVWKSTNNSPQHLYIDYRITHYGPDLLQSSIEKASMLSSYSNTLDNELLENGNIIIKIINEEKKDYSVNLLIPNQEGTTTLITAKTENKEQLLEIVKILLNYEPYTKK
jgi:hypothetical protein